MVTRPGRNFVPFAAGHGRPGSHRPTAREHTQRALVVRDRRPPVSAVSAAPTASGGPSLSSTHPRVRSFDAGDSLRMSDVFRTPAVARDDRPSPSCTTSSSGHRADRRHDHHRVRSRNAHLPPRRVPGHRPRLRRTCGLNVPEDSPVRCRTDSGGRRMHPPRTAGAFLGPAVVQAVTSGRALSVSRGESADL